MKKPSIAIAYQNFVESFIKNHVADSKHHVVKIETILNLFHLRTNNNYLDKSDSQIIFEGLISCLGGKKLKDKDKVKGIQSNYNQILVPGYTAPVTLTDFCKLNNFAIKTFYRELALLKRYYNAVLCFTLEYKTIEIDPQYKFTKLWDLIEKDRLTYNFIYHIINNNNFLIEFEEEHKVINEVILETDQENIIKSAIENNSSELKIIEGPFTDIDDFDQEVLSYFETYKMFQQKYLLMQEKWEQENFIKIVSKNDPIIDFFLNHINDTLENDFFDKKLNDSLYIIILYEFYRNKYFIITIIILTISRS